MSDWRSNLSRFTSDVQWSVKRIGPEVYEGKIVPLGIYPIKLAGACTPEKLSMHLGGGQYVVTPHDVAENDWSDPINVLGAPRFKIDLVNEGGDPVEAIDEVPMPEPVREDPSDRLVEVYDPAFGGWHKKRAAEIERDNQRKVRDAFEAKVDSLRVSHEKSIESIAALTQTIREKPKEDNGSGMFAKFIELENKRLEADLAAKRDELKYLREKMDIEREMAKEQREAEVKALERKAQEERARLDRQMETLQVQLREDRKIAEQRVLDERKAVSDQLKEAHDMVLKMLESKGNTTDQFSSVIQAYRDIKEIMEPTPEYEEPNPKDAGEEKSITERVLDRFLGLVDSMTNDPMTKKVIAQKIGALFAPGAEQAPAQQQAQLANPPATVPAQAAPSTQEDQESVAMLASALKMITDIRSGIDGGTPPSSIWTLIQKEQPLLCGQIRGYKDVEHMAADLDTLAGNLRIIPNYAPQADAIQGLAEKVRGAGRDWAEQFLNCVHGVASPAKSS
jgi:hypothetical protein